MAAAGREGWRPAKLVGADLRLLRKTLTTPMQTVVAGARALLERRCWRKAGNRRFWPVWPIWWQSPESTVLAGSELKLGIDHVCR